MNAAGFALPGRRPDEALTLRQRVTVCYPFAGDAIGGSHFSVRGLLSDLDPERYRVLVVPEVPGGKIAEHFADFELLTDPAGATVPFVPGEKFNPSKFVSALAGLSKRARFLRRHDVDIVHSNDGRTHATWSLAARLAGARLVWHHRADPDALGLNLLAPLVASKVLTVSTFSLPKARFWSAANKAEVVFSPFDTDIEVDRTAARRKILESAGVPDEALLLGIFGNFVPRKRPLLFVDMIAELRSRLDRPIFGLMFGKANVPEMDRRLRDHIAHREMQDAVRLMGFRSPGHEWIAGCDQLIVPAVGEPLGRTLVEAMLVGTPVIATRSGGNGEALAGDTGVLVEPKSAAALADGVERLVAEPRAAQEMVKRARISARQRFGRKRHAVSVMRVYDELLGRQPALV
ncbi:glycosyltransferase family 4 protein [Erythrobacter sp.]|jgi:glycosyltransferase involved in cell wall biosynthesis|uniref:glycosyltransferase family 4 protein n=1 Tax=Erythrobacter sp. TaxID=1042 RepID=UPI002EC17041|nr:glycosyltransferase family 4 protein [Erythrobacter sp.]